MYLIINSKVAETKSEATPFNERFTEYFEDRDTKRMLREINGRKKLNALYKMQKGICPHCGEPITVKRGFRIYTEVGADFKEKVFRTPYSKIKSGHPEKAFHIASYALCPCLWAVPT